MATQIDLIGQAYVLLGEQPITSLTEGTRPALIASQLYETTYKNALSIEPWHFASNEVQLSRLSAETNNDYTYAFQLPADLLSVITVNQGRGSNDYDIYGDKLYANAEEISLLYVAQVDEGFLPGWFEEYFIYALATKFSVPLTDSTARRDDFFKMSKSALAEARYINSRQAPINGWDTLSDLGHTGGSVNTRLS